MNFKNYAENIYDEAIDYENVVDQEELDGILEYTEINTNFHH